MTNMTFYNPQATAMLQQMDVPKYLPSRTGLNSSHSPAGTSQTGTTGPHRKLKIMDDSLEILANASTEQAS